MVAQAQGSGDARRSFQHDLVRACRALDLSLGDDQLERMWRHYTLMVAANRTTNLTRITAPDQAAVKHYADSLALLACCHDRLDENLRLLDVGTGAGFPAVPLAICRPDWQVTAVDSTAKKATFVQQVAGELALANLTVQCVRGRELAGRAVPFDVVTCRAVADLIACLRQTRRLVAPGGCTVCYTTPAKVAGLASADRRQAERLGFMPPEQHDYRLVLAAGTIRRSLVIWSRT